EEQKAEYIELLNEQAAKRNEKQSVEKQLEQLIATKANRKTKFETLLQERQLLLEKLEESKSICTKQKQLCEQAELELKELKNNINEERKKTNHLQEKLAAGQQTIAKYNSRKELLEEMKEDFQGFYYGVKAVLQAREENK